MNSIPGRWAPGHSSPFLSLQSLLLWLSAQAPLLRANGGANESERTDSTSKAVGRTPAACVPAPVGQQAGPPGLGAGSLMLPLPWGRATPLLDPLSRLGQLLREGATSLGLA